MIYQAYCKNDSIIIESFYESKCPDLRDAKFVDHFKTKFGDIDAYASTEIGPFFLISAESIEDANSALFLYDNNILHEVRKRAKKPQTKPTDSWLDKVKSLLQERKKEMKVDSSISLTTGSSISLTTGSSISLTTGSSISIAKTIQFVILELEKHKGEIYSTRAYDALIEAMSIDFDIRPIEVRQRFEIVGCDMCGPDWIKLFEPSHANHPESEGWIFGDRILYNYLFTYTFRAFNQLRPYTEGMSCLIGIEQIYAEAKRRATRS